MGRLRDTVLAVSHRWESPTFPDPSGTQLAVMKERLAADSKIEFVWIDFSCMPQGKRTKNEEKEFDSMLPNINLIYLASQVLIIMDSSYFSRFWTFFEAWLSMQMVEPCGLIPDPHT